MALLPRVNEDRLIDNYRPKTASVAPSVTQDNTPGENLSTVGGVPASALPSPTIGGENGSRIRNGFSTGFRGVRARLAPFTGAMAKPPAITNPVQGDVGTSARASKLYAGVMNQQVQYAAAQSAAAASYVGKVAG